MSVNVVSYQLRKGRSVAAWPKIKIAVLADLHACWPAMTNTKVRQIIKQTNALRPDLICMLGDYVGHSLGCVAAEPEAVATALTQLRAPLGVYGVFGNHDWWDDKEASRQRLNDTKWHRAFAAAGLKMLCNDAVVIDTPKGGFSLAGLDSQRAYRLGPSRDHIGAANLDVTLTKLHRERTTILMAHEPDIFFDLPDYIGLTLAGHTHGGQIRLLGRPWVVPSNYGTALAYGHYEQGNKQMVVSGGLGTSGLPLRIGMPPEITMVELI
ncbi:MAG: metallophosphoesterase [Marinovum sp.]|nr:metallophosphoesterase [Marinovum sp.]